jgi:hypothetical protein
MKSIQNHLWFIANWAVIIVPLAMGSLFSQDYVNAQLPWHKAVLDSQGRILAWYHPEKNLGYDQFLRLDWDFIEHKVPNEGNTGLKVYLINSIYEPETLRGIKSSLDNQHNPASANAHFVDLLMGWYPYSGDEEAIRVVREMLDYQLAHGTTPEDWDWAGVPFATSCDDALEYGRCIRDMPADFYGGIETDKIGELGLGYVLVYEMTGERKYLEAGVKCAEALAKHVRPGDATHTPWPFRVDARKGEVIAGEEFGGMIVAPVRLFDEILRLRVGDTEGFRKARDLAWSWILNNLLNTSSPAWDRWTGYYEDVQKDTENVNDQTSMMTAYYILSHDDPSTVDPQWQTHVGYLLDRSRGLLGRGPFYGAWAIDEQQRPLANIPYTSARGCCSRAGLSCRTSAWGAINAMYYEKTGDGTARENAFRSLNYATYFAASDGKIACCGSGAGSPLFWFEDGYADAGRSFTWALGAVPDFAPVGQDHLLRASSPVQKVSYGNRRIEYRTFGKAGTEVLRLSFRPGDVSAGGTRLTEQSDLNKDGYTVQPLQGGDFVVRVRHTRANDLTINGS